MSEQAPGKVYLVGAGPGDSGLITQRAAECLARADVVIYDHLANEALLALAPPRAERLYAGKMADRHTMTQAEIEQLLVTKAREGRTVVRLKGGDPFVFGRGAEEALALRDAGIAFEIVPGVTSAVAVPAYAGIPVTHRGCAASFHVFTAHEAPDKERSDLDWKTIARLDGTLVFLMGMRMLEHVAAQLMGHGRPADTPVALVRWGTLPEQQTLTGSLGDIVQKAAEAGFAPPVVTVIGEVVRLRSTLRWFEAKPLFGYRAALTRPREQSEELAALLHDAGADIAITPTIAIQPRPLDEAMRRELLRLHAYDWVVFTSANGVSIFFDYIGRLGLDARALSDCRVAAIGEKTGETLTRHGIRPDAVPGHFVQEALAEAIPVRPGDHVLIPRAAVARDALERMLTERGAAVRVLPVYDTVCDEAGVRALCEGLESRRINLVTFTSASTVESLSRTLSSDRLRALFEGVTIASIGPLTSAALRQAGLDVHVEAKIHTARHLADAIIACLKDRADRTAE
jgi:uroporphyrinogen III methyltransferase/synthase